MATTPISQRETWGLAGLSALGLLLRLAPALRTDAQFDEIYSITQVAACRSFLDLFGANMRTDNNHLLNSIGCYLAGTREAWVCRLPSVLLGAAAVPLAWAIGRRQGGPREGWIAAALIVCSYPLIHYSSEARGYAAVACFALLSFLLLEGLRGEDRPLRRLAAFWAACALGLLAHFSFIIVLAGYGIGEAVLFFRRDLRRPGPALRRLAALYLPVLAVSTASYLLWIRSLRILGGPIYDNRTVAEWFLAEAMNAPFRTSAGAFLAACAAATAAFAAHGIWRLRRDDRAVFFAALLLCAPLLVLLTAQPRLVYSRYFFVLLPFTLLAVGHSLASLFAGGARLRIPGLLFAAAFLAMGAERIAALTARGKSHYADTVRFVLDEAAGRGRLTLCASKQQMTELVVRHFEGGISAGRDGARIVFAPAENLWQGEGICDFAVVSRDTLELYRVDPERTPVLLIGERALRLVFARPSADRLETDWFVYRP